MTMWTAKELNEMCRVAPSACHRHNYRQCSHCREYVDNRNYRRHVAACSRRARLQREFNDRVYREKLRREAAMKGVTVYEKACDVKGEQIHPGDRVSIKLHPRGTVRGVVAVSDRAFVVEGDQQVPALVVVDDEGNRYGLPSPKGVRKLLEQL